MAVHFHKIELFVIDYDNYGIGPEKFIQDMLLGIEGSARIIKHEYVPIKNWEDDHILNYTLTPTETFEQEFEKLKAQ